MVAFWNQAIELTWGELIISMFAGVGIAMTVMTLVSIIRDSLRRRATKGKRHA